MRKSVLILIILILTIIVGALYWYLLLPKEPPVAPLSPTPTPTQTSTVTLGELTLCKYFEKVEGEISCEEALSIAKKKYPGIIQEISSGVFQKEETSSEVNIWITEIKLDKPIIKNDNTFYTIRLFLRRDNGEQLRITRGSE